MTVTVLSGPERRRRWATAEKLRMVEECLTAETSIVEVARRHDVHPNQLHGWRRQARLGLLGTDAAAVAQECRFVPIAVATVEDKISNLSKEAPPTTHCRLLSWCCAMDGFCAYPRV